MNKTNPVQSHYRSATNEFINVVNSIGSKKLFHGMQFLSKLFGARFDLEMLFYVRLLVPDSLPFNIPVNLHPSDAVEVILTKYESYLSQEIINVIQKKRPDLKVNRVLFSGRILKCTILIYLPIQFQPINL